MASLNRCTCGRMPTIRARDTNEGTVVTQATCPRIECGKQGLSIEDFERNDDVATKLWNQHGGRAIA